MSKLYIRSILAIAFSLLSYVCSAHPSWGIVVGQDGNIYYVDVMHHGDGGLCRINPSSNKLEVIQDNLHAHYLQVDNNGILWAAADLWHEGEIEGEGHHYLVKCDPSTNIIDTVFFTDDEDVFFGNNFAVDGKNGVVYFTIHNKIFANDFRGQTTQVIDHEFGWINTFNTDQQGNIWITDKQKDNGTLYQWNKEEGLNAYAANLLQEPIADPIFKEANHHRLYAIGFDVDGSPLLCDNATRTIRKIGPSGVIDTVYKSPDSWHPIGIYTYNGRYYVMETGWNKKGHLGPKIIILDESFNKTEEIIINATTKTIRKITASKNSPQEGTQRKSMLVPAISGSLIIILLVSVIRQRKRKHK